MSSINLAIVAVVYFAIGGICAGGYVEVHKNHPRAIDYAHEAAEIFIFWPFYLTMWIGRTIVKIAKRTDTKAQ